MTAATEMPPLTVVLAAPRGFCAGVDRAVQIVERLLASRSAPVYVRHEIVHNRFVVEGLEAKGAVFVEELDEVPDGAAVVFSAHGVPKSVPAEAKRRGLAAVDATCPLVSKVHMEAARRAAEGCQIILIGHAGHPEVVGTMGQVPPESLLLVETAADAEAVAPATPDALAYVTQTTLSVDETREIIAILKRRFPAIAGPKREDICFATTNRQAAVKAIAGSCDAVWVIGAPNSSNSRRLVEVAALAGCPDARLIQGPEEIDWASLGGVSRLGITAGASAPEVLVEAVLAALAARRTLAVEEARHATETLAFKLPIQVRNL
ncbi:4-hydroxy-3-methylbut-2-enyl diphosphate reductase [Oleispirillum naphthae]|uniref:4-hydroxy-3-methylbut-2-enyl diphosphate reductase n=1 Tax=Oleispirillum naphthae TaxID=2838853 RepID=UPI0030825F36